VGAAPFFGTFIPQEAFAQNFNGKIAAGDWTLEIVDSRPTGNGKLNNWSLTLG